MQQIVEGFLFKFICDILPESDETGQLKTFQPQSRYKKRDKVELHKYGNGPFCRFRIPTKLHLEGVYLLTVNDTPYYVGECVNLSRRYNADYGQISPRNCYVGGQMTNCRINHLIYSHISQGDEIALWFYETSDRIAIESNLIRNLKTREFWNRKG